MRIARSLLLAHAVIAAVQLSALAQTPAAPATASPPSLDAQERFLLTAKVIRARGINTGVTGTTRLLDLDMIPPSVERIYNGKKGSFTWWVDDVAMDEAARVKKKIATPDPARWNQQMWHVRLFDQLIYNVDRNLGNLLIDTDWRIWMIDHTRAFRLADTLRSEGDLGRVDRRLLERLKALDRGRLVEATKSYLTPFEINALLKRRDLIVQHFERAPGAVFDWDRPTRR